MQLCYSYGLAVGQLTAQDFASPGCCSASLTTAATSDYGRFPALLAARGVGASGSYPGFVGWNDVFGLVVAVRYAL